MNILLFNLYFLPVFQRTFRVGFTRYVLCLENLAAFINYCLLERLLFSKRGANVKPFFKIPNFGTIFFAFNLNALSQRGYFET